MFLGLRKIIRCHFFGDLETTAQLAVFSPLLPLALGTDCPALQGKEKQQQESCP